MTRARRALHTDDGLVSCSLGHTIAKRFSYDDPEDVSFSIDIDLAKSYTMMFLYKCETLLNCFELTCYLLIGAVTPTK